MQIYHCYRAEDEMYRTLLGDNREMKQESEIRSKEAVKGEI